MIRTWPCPLPDGSTTEELAVRHGEGTKACILFLPPIFDEHNKLRRQLVEIMRRLADAGITTILPDLPGLNESRADLTFQTLASWRDAAQQAAKFFEASHVFSVRSGALLAPEDISGWRYAPQSGESLLRGLIRARQISSREAGRPESREELIATGRQIGLILAGWSISAHLFSELEAAQLGESGRQVDIDQSSIGGNGLWLRAEPDEDASQADALTTVFLEELAKPE